MIRNLGNSVEVKYLDRFYICWLIDLSHSGRSTALTYYDHRSKFHECIFEIVDSQLQTLVDLGSVLARMICRQIEFCSMVSDWSPEEIDLDNRLFPHHETIAGIEIDSFLAEGQTDDFQRF